MSLVIRQEVFFSFQNNPKNLDPSYKMDIDLSDCLGRIKVILEQNFMGLLNFNLYICTGRAVTNVVRTCGLTHLLIFDFVSNKICLNHFCSDSREGKLHLIAE